MIEGFLLHTWRAFPTGGATRLFNWAVKGELVKEQKKGLSLLEMEVPREAQRVVSQQWLGLRASFIDLLFSEGRDLSDPLPEQEKN